MATLTNAQLRKQLKDALADQKGTVTAKLAAGSALTAAEAKQLKNELADMKGLAAKLAAGIQAPVSAVAATYVGTPAGAATPITLTANVAGLAGNSITLTFTGSNTITQAISTWNGAHAGNMVTLSSGSGAQTPTAGSVSLTGGANAVVANQLTAAQKKDLKNALADQKGQLTDALANDVNFSS